jgi:DNA-binding response OmpR family regulator
VATVGVCEDEPALRSVLTRGLRTLGHEPIAVATAAEALRAFRGSPPDILVLDIGLPDGDGRDLSLALRAAGVGAPILFLTARDGLHDKVAGFESGGDDYLTKPFEFAELRVRLDALLRRVATPSRSEPDQLVLDSVRHSLLRADCEVELTPTEFRLMGRLMSEPGRVVRTVAATAAARSERRVSTVSAFAPASSTWTPSTSRPEVRVAATMDVTASRAGRECGLTGSGTPHHGES